MPPHADEFEALVPLGTKAAKAGPSDGATTVFKTFSRGVATCRDEVAYGFDRAMLAGRVRQFIDDYNGEVDRYKRSGRKQPIDEFVRYDKIKWSRDLKADLQRDNYAAFDEGKIRTTAYRPFCKRYLFFDRILNEEVYVNPSIFPTPASETENRIIITSDLAFRSPAFSALAAGGLVDLHLCAAVDAHQCFPFYVYDEDGTNRRENVTNWALEHFRKHYADEKITKWDIFYYVYAVLHHPEYRLKFGDNLKRELPRIPLAKDFLGFVGAGKELADLHINYETVEPCPLKYVETGGATKPGGRRAPPLSYRVEDKMRLSKDRRSLRVNDTLTLSGIPPETFEYRLGNRSALEWAIDQYRVTENKRNGIRSDPNRADDPEYIVKLVQRVIRVSLETVRIVKSLPSIENI